MFRPLVIFVKAASQEGVRRLHRSARVDNRGGSFSGLSVSETVIYISTVLYYI